MSLLLPPDDEARQRPITVLGATGSIGQATLDVARHLGLPLFALTAHHQVERLAALARTYRPQAVVIADPARHAELRAALVDLPSIRVLAGSEALCEVAADPACGMVVTAIVGAAGLPATLAAVRSGKRVGIANKEPLVMAGRLVLAEAARSGARLLPIDSEHSAIFQCLEGHGQAEVDRLILTGSGGPFRERADLSGITVAQALNHPTWAMGPKITIDSASLMNKALEVVEARWLFGFPAERIDLLIHPQSVVHSLVSYVDGSLIAQLGRPDMRTPIQYALTWPQHRPGPVPAPDLAALGRLTFEAPRRDRFPSIALGYAAAADSGLMGTVLNAANECAVAAFLAGRLDFTGIFRRLEAAVARTPAVSAPDLDTILAVDAEVRARESAL